MNVVIASAAKQSSGKNNWIASSQVLLAMTGKNVSRVDRN
jgi:hypothetical protein